MKTTLIDFREKYVPPFIQDKPQTRFERLRVWLKEPKIMPLHPQQVDKEGEGFYHDQKKYITHTQLDHANSAFYRVSLAEGIGLILVFNLFVFGLIDNWRETLIITLALMTAVYFLDLLFNVFLVIQSLVYDPQISVTNEELALPRDWPSYTIFCPLYKEYEVLPQFVKAMSSLDYPKDKLQIMLLLEENDPETIERAKSLNLPNYFQVVVVPHSFPKTKPKACNYGLKLARGEYLVIYDAEDIPESTQLKKAVLAFEKADPKISCIQAKLNFYNPHQNLLTRAFTAEYSLWFDLVLPGMQAVQAPIPLGGTSNHFRTHQLRLLHGWDPFNVTEDCDLGIRLSKSGLNTAIMNSTTLEEANSSFKNWLPQRTRWIKGYMQTYLVHIRNPKKFLKKQDLRSFVMFQIIVGGKVASMLVNPWMWIITALYFIARPILGPTIQSLYPAPVLYTAVISLVAGNFLYFYNYMIGCAKHGRYELIKYVFVVPVYWLGMSMAAYIALYKLIRQPHHWSKTKHGLHLDSANAVSQVNRLLNVQT